MSAARTPGRDRTAGALRRSERRDCALRDTLRQRRRMPIPGTWDHGRSSNGLRSARSCAVRPMATLSLDRASTLPSGRLPEPAGLTQHAGLWGASRPNRAPRVFGGLRAEIARLLGFSLVARLPQGMDPLAVLLLVESRTGSVAGAGAANPAGGFRGRPRPGARA